jgi:hypothetical protein
MGVMACDRKGCENIMCDHYSDAYGYICYECLQDLYTKERIDIDAFMNTRRGVPFMNGLCTWEDHCDIMFPTIVSVTYDE